MTQLIGKPDVPANTPLKATVTYTGAYQRGDALGIGTVTYTWDWTDSRWERTDGTLANIIAARFNQNDPAPPALRILFRIGTGDGTLGRPVEVLAAETAAGVLDVTKPLLTAPYIRGEELAALIASTDTARTAAQTAATAATTAAQTAQVAATAAQTAATTATQTASQADARVTAAIASIGVVSTTVYGLALGATEPGAYGGTLTALISNAPSALTATITPGAHGGLTYTLGEPNA